MPRDAAARTAVHKLVGLWLQLVLAPSMPSTPARSTLPLLRYRTRSFPRLNDPLASVDARAEHVFDAFARPVADLPRQRKTCSRPRVECAVALAIASPTSGRLCARRRCRTSAQCSTQALEVCLIAAQEGTALLGKPRSGGEAEVKLRDNAISEPFAMITSRMDAKRNRLDCRIATRPEIRLRPAQGWRSQVKSRTNTPVMQGAKQMHIERRCDYELPRQSCRLGRACVDFFLLTHVLLWYCLELPRKGSAKGGGICDA
jgi:hypothetical protein